MHMCSLNHCFRCGNCTQNPGMCDTCRQTPTVAPAYFPYEFVRMDEFNRLEGKVDFILDKLKTIEKLDKKVEA